MAPCVQSLRREPPRTAARSLSIGGRNLTELSTRVLQSRSSIWFPSYRWHSALPLSNPPTFPFCLNPPFQLVFHLNCLSLHSKFHQPSNPTLLQTSLYPSGSPREVLPLLLESTCSMLGGRSARLRVLCLISGVQSGGMPGSRASVGLNDVKGS